jgi:hypothetical protein
MSLFPLLKRFLKLIGPLSHQSIPQAEWDLPVHGIAFTASIRGRTYKCMLTQAEDNTNENFGGPVKGSFT